MMTPLCQHGKPAYTPCAECGPISFESSVTITTNANYRNGAPSWNFCPGCGLKLEPAWKHCPGCALTVGATGNMRPNITTSSYSAQCDWEFGAPWTVAQP